ncbi:MAG TPA: tRNA (N6-threonylcarbamoyladenosine(37)-N6)-methyltransferase TrmO [Terriglobales bacterium]|nr:tRNA (N6-threonylcarbamoyladenosine(37)-N6)-methyltransferase TrmO [Terriglobales bacterium]
MSEKLSFRPIGVVRTSVSDNEVKERHGEYESTVEVFPEFEEGLTGLDGFSHIFVMCYLHKLRPDQIGPLKVRPRRLLKAGFKIEELPLVGVFSIDSPTRPNAIGLTLAKLIRREGRKLIVTGLDYFDGTPVLDIKPYRDDYRAEHFDVANWYMQLIQRVGGPV